ISHYTGFQAYYNNALVISPTSPNIVLAGSAGYIRSMDGGQTWEGSPMFNGDLPGLLHAGADEMRYQGGTLYIACDGGVWSSPDNGNTATDRNSGLVTR